MSVQMTESIIVKGSAEELFDLWSDFETFPSVMKDIKSITKIDDERSHWAINGPLGKEISWTGEITRFEEDRRIAWRTIDGDIKTSGQVTFKDLPDHQTEVTVLMQYVPPAGKVGEIASQIIDAPRKKLTEGLRDFKSYAENMPEVGNKSSGTQY